MNIKVDRLLVRNHQDCLIQGGEEWELEKTMQWRQ